MYLTPSQENLLRQRPHQANLFLSIYRPKTLMAAQVASGTYSTGEITIPYYAVSTGTYLNLYADLTVLVGETPGGSEFGRIRMRSATGTYAVMAENAINWQTNQYLTFIDQIDIQAIYPRIIQDPNNQTNVIFYKDWDITYTNQNSIYGTFPNAGPHRAGFISSGTFFFSATGTTNVLGDSLTYSWLFEGGTPTGSTALTPGNVRWFTPGHYRVRLRTTSALGAVDDTYRYVSMYDRPNEGTNTPPLRWELTELSGSRNEGGYTASFKIYENLGEIQPNAIVVLFSDNYYGSTQINLGGNAINNSSIIFVGYIIGDSIKFNYQESSVEFSVGSVSEIMKNTEGFSVSCESKASPSTWFELYQMNTSRAMYHYLRWHSTVLKVTDFQYTGDDRLVQYFDADRGSLYDSVDSFLRDGMLGGLTSDRQGKLWGEINPFGLQNPFSSIPNYLTLQKQDWMGDPSITERRNSEMSFVELGGIIYYGVESNGFVPSLTNAPSTAPLYHGKSERKEGLILNDQQQLNQLSGNYLAHHNSQFPEISMPLNGIYTNLDIAPLERYLLVISQNDTVRNKSLQGLSYYVDNMEWKYDSVNQSFIPDIVLHQIVTGTAGVTVDIPPVPPDMGYAYPSLNLPPLPVFNAAGGQQIPSNGARTVIIHDTTSGPHTGKGLLYTPNFDASIPTWVFMNAGLTSAQYIAINNIKVTPNGAVYVASEGRWDRGVRTTPFFIAYAPKVGAPFIIVANQDTVEAEYTTGVLLGLGGLGFRSDAPETVIYFAGEKIGDGTSNNGHIHLGSYGGGFAKPLQLTDITYDLFGCSFTFGQNTWGLLAYTAVGFSVALRFHTFNATATTQTALVTTGGNSSKHIRGGISGVLFNPDHSVSGQKWYRSMDNGQTWAEIPDSNDMSGPAMACDDYGQYMMGNWQAAADKGRSSDYGTTWGPLSNLPPGTTNDYGYMGGENISSQWVAIGDTTVRYSPDWGNTWMNREGNLITLLGTGAMDIVYPIR